MSGKLHRVLWSNARRIMRGFILELSVLSVFTVLVALESHASGQIALPVTILQFGAFPGDGRDDTDAMQASADYLSAHPGTTLIYPPGVYNITRTVDLEHEFSPDWRDKGVVYSNCHDVKVLGVGAIIDVKGDFEKREHPQAPHTADKFAYNAFVFLDSSNFTLAGFEVNGHVDQTTVADPSVFLGEGYSDAVVTSLCHDYLLENLYIHHMVTDGIAIGTDQNLTIRHVTCANSARNALTIGPAKNVYVVDSVLRDSGVVGTAPNSYPGHLPEAGVDVEPEAWPADADWKPAGVSTVPYLPGNILFDRVRVTGNLNIQIAMGHFESSANVTVRNSFIQNPPGGHQYLFIMGITGAVVEDSILDAQNGHIRIALFPQYAVYAEAQNNSAIFHHYLDALAADPFPPVQTMFRETRGFSITMRRNTIRGQDTILYCQTAFPFLDIIDNQFQGAQPAAPPSYFGYMLVHVAAEAAFLPPGATWTPVTNIKRNQFFIPQTAPRGIGYGDIDYYGVTHLEGNQYTTDGNGSSAFRVAYGKVATVVNDRFPTDGSIIPIRHPDGFQYTLSEGRYFNFPQ